MHKSLEFLYEKLALEASLPPFMYVFSVGKRFLGSNVKVGSYEKNNRCIFGVDDGVCDGWRCCGGS